MFDGWWNKSRRPIGLDLGAHSIKMIQFAEREGLWSARAAVSRAIPPTLPASGEDRAEALAQMIRQMVAGGGFAGRQVVSCLPAAAVQYKNLRLPRMPADEMRAAVEWEAADRLKLSPGAVSLQFLDAGEVRQGEEARQEIIVLAAPRAMVEEHVDMLCRAGLQPVAIDSVPTALVRALGSGDPDPDGPAQVLLDVGYAASKVVITRGGQIVFFKLIDIGGQKLDETVAQHLKLRAADAADLRRRLQRPPGAPEAPGEAGADGALGSMPRESLERAVFEKSLRATAGELAKELGLCLRYYSVTFRGQRPEQLKLAGGETYEPQLAKVLAEGAGIGVEPARPLDGIDLRGAGELEGAGTTLSEWAVAAGLSLRERGEMATRSAA